MAGILDAYKENHETVSIDSTKKVRVGIIGTGWIAEAHVDEYKKMPDVEIIALADIVPGKAEEFAEKFGVKGANCYTSHKELLDKEKLDAVSVCTYNSTHAECAIDAMKAGVNVLLEKPLCVTLEEAVQIRKTEKETGKILSVGFQPRFDPDMQMVKKIVQSGVLGRIYYIQTGGGRRRGIPTPFGTSFIDKEKAGIGALGDIGCYSLDMVLNAINYPKPLSVSGYTSDFFGKSKKYWNGVNKPEEYSEVFGVDDFAAAFVRLEGGIILDFRISWAMHMDTPGDTLIYGTEGALRIPSTDCWNGPIGGPLKLYQTISGETACTVIDKKLPTKEGNFYFKIRSFLDAIKNGGEAPVPTSEIIYNQAIIDGIVKSHNLGKEIEIEIPEI